MPKYQFRFSTIPGDPHDQAYFIETETIEGVGVGSDHGFEWQWDYHDGIGTALLVVPDDPALVKALVDARDAIKSLPKNALGRGQSAWTSWPLKYGLLRNINAALENAGEEDD